MSPSQIAGPSQAAIEETVAAVVGTLRGHPCLLSVHAAPVHTPAGPAVVAWVQPEQASVRIPVEGACSLIGDSGEEYPAELVDVSFDGMSVRLAEGHQPEIGARLQANVQTDAFAGGIEGWLVTVCWQQEQTLGLAFEGNWDERGALSRFIHDCAESGQPTRTPVPTAGLAAAGRAPRVAIDLPCEVEVVGAGGQPILARSIDLSSSGVGLEVREPDGVEPVAGEAAQILPHGAEVTVRLRVHEGQQHPMQGVVVRRVAGFAAIAFEPTEETQDWLRTLVESAIATRLVSTRGLRNWVSDLDLPEPRLPLHIVVVDPMPFDKATGEVDEQALPRPFFVTDPE